MLYIIGMCYQVVKDPLNWNDAKEECNSMAGYDDHATLASINSYQEQIFISSE